MKKSLPLFALAAGVCLSATTFAQTTETRTPTCADVTWSDQLREVVPNIETHCLEIVQRDGNYFAKVQARIVRQSGRTTFVRLRNADGTWGDVERAHPPAGFRADIEGREVRISDLGPRQEVNVYYGPQSPVTFTVAGFADENPQEVEPMEIVEEEPAPVVLPSTAGQAGWLAIFGAMLLLLGGAARFARNRA